MTVMRGDTVIVPWTTEGHNVETRTVTVLPTQTSTATGGGQEIEHLGIEGTDRETAIIGIGAMILATVAHADVTAL